MSTALELEDVWVNRGRSAVLRGFSLHVTPGQIVVVTGPNGSGKTTLVEAIAGSVPLQSGCIRLEGEDIGRFSVAERARLGIGITPELRRLFPSMSVRDNLLLAARTWGLDERQARVRIGELALTYPIVATKLNEPVRNLSGGQQQLVAIARSLLCSPGVLVLDEPSIGLSPGSWAAVLDQCRDLASSGHSVLIVEQRVLDVAKIASSAVALEEGVGRIVDTDSLTTGDGYSAGDPA